MMVRNWAIAGLVAVCFAGPAATSAELQRVTWPKAVNYVIQHGSACSFFWTGREEPRTKRRSYG